MKGSTLGRCSLKLAYNVKSISELRLYANNFRSSL